MKRVILSLILLNIIGCVHSEVGEGPEKMKSTTVWNSDLRLNYDSVYDKENIRGEEPAYEEYDNRVDGYVAPLDKVIAEEIEAPLEIEEVDSMEVDKLIEEKVSLKIKNDELETKRFEDTAEIDIEKKKNGKTKWLLLLASFTTLGGFYSSIKKKNKK